MSQEITVVDTGKLTAAQIRADVNLIQEVMKAVMVKGVHYDKIPGCGSKDVLLKPGAEKIASTFRLAIEPIVEDLSKEDEIRFRVSAKVNHQLTGQFLGTGIGEASTGEDKYKWRKVMSTDEWEATPEDRRRIKYSDGYQTRQIRTNPSDLANTVLKMAKKRALIDAVLTITSASDCFTQDIEDLPEELAQEIGSKKEAPIAEPKPATETSEPKQATKAPVPAKERMRSMGARFASKCKACSGAIELGDPMYYDGDNKAAYHPECVA